MPNLLNTIFSISVIIVSLSFNIAFCAGITGADFLKINPGTVSSGMGNTGVALPLNTESIMLNPAAITLMQKKMQLELSHLMWWESINYEYVAYICRIGNIGFVGGNIIYLYMPKLQVTDALGFATDEELKISDFAGNFVYAKKISRIISIGLNTKYIKRVLGNYSATAYAMDIGTLFQIKTWGTKHQSTKSKQKWRTVRPGRPNQTAKSLNIGLVVQNIGTKIKFIDVEDDLPLNIKTGIGYYSHRLKIAFDIDKPIYDEVIKSHFGIEYKINPTISCRTGYERSDDLGSLSGITAGLSYNTAGRKPSSLDRISLTLKKKSKVKLAYKFDYSIRYCADFSFVHSVSLKIFFTSNR